MNKELLDKFVCCIEELMEQCGEKDLVRDSRGYYSKRVYLNNLILEAKELIKYGEREVALENMLENLYEVSIFIDEDVANIARKAFGERISSGTENILVSLVNKLE